MPPCTALATCSDAEETPITAPTPDDERVRVSPRYLAGPRVDPAVAFDQLTSTFGWISHSTDESLFYTSPCHRVRAGFLGEAMAPWQITASEYPLAPPDWIAAFDGTTPPEIVNAFLTTVADNLETVPDRTFQMNLHYVDTAIAPLRQAGWSVRIGDHDTTVDAPSGLAGIIVHRHPQPWQAEEFDPYDETWRIWAGPPEERWSAEFSRDTPLPLISAAARALIATGPVERHREDLHPACLPHLTVRPAGQPAADRIKAALATSRSAPPPLAVSGRPAGETPRSKPEQATRRGR
ncbi:hypothetical protein ABH940_005601 [Streptacidiphilus sp. BW17]|uniref:DUF317 domain-containing protein n=1 Tax=Streptacidiphilus sp. BW17 TaxID=3156274 RepID=UPI003511D00B